MLELRPEAVLCSSPIRLRQRPVEQHQLQTVVVQAAAISLKPEHQGLLGLLPSTEPSLH